MAEEHLDEIKTAGEGVSHTKITKYLPPSKGVGQKFQLNRRIDRFRKTFEVTGGSSEGA